MIRLGETQSSWLKPRNQIYKRKPYETFLYDKDEISCPHVTKFKWVEIKRHVLVKDTTSPDDPQLKTYWER